MSQNEPSLEKLIEGVKPQVEKVNQIYSSLDSGLGRIMSESQNTYLNFLTSPEFPKIATHYGEDRSCWFNLWKIAEENYRFLAGSDELLREKMIKTVKENVILREEEEMYKPKGIICEDSRDVQGGTFYQISFFFRFISVHAPKIRESFSFSWFRELYEDIRELTSRIDYPFLNEKVKLEMHETFFFLEPMFEMIKKLKILERIEEINLKYNSLDVKLGELFADLQGKYLGRLCNVGFRRVEQSVSEVAQPEHSSPEHIRDKRKWYAQEREKIWFGIFKITEENYDFLNSCSKDLAQTIKSVILNKKKELEREEGTSLKHVVGARDLPSVEEYLRLQGTSLYVLNAFLRTVQIYVQNLEETSPSIQRIVLNNLLEEMQKDASIFNYVYNPLTTEISLHTAENFQMIEKYNWDEDLLAEILKFPDRIDLHRKLYDFVKKVAVLENHQVGKTRMMVQTMAKYALKSKNVFPDVQILTEIYGDYYHHFEGNDLNKGIEILKALGKVM